MIFLDSIEPVSSPLYSNEDSSLHSSPTQSQPSSQSQYQNIIQHEEQVSDSEVMSDSVPNSSSPSQASSPQKSQECKLYEEVDDDGEYTQNNCDDDVMESMCTDDQDKEQSEEYDRDNQISANVEKLSLVNGNGENDKVGDEYDDHGAEVDEDDQNGVDKLNGLEHREDIHVADSQLVVPNMKQTGKHVCELCHISFSTLFDLNRHTRKYTISKLIKCPWPNCYKAFAQNADLQVHLESHTGKHTLETKEEMDTDLHVEENERSGKGSRDNELDNEQMDSDEDDEHVGNNKELTGQVGDDDEDCGHGVDQLNGLEHRNNKIDGNEAQNEVQMAENESTGQVAVLVHKSPTGKLVCEHCGKGFTTRYNLTVHIRNHTGDRPYKCPKCPKTYNQSAHMKQHIMTQHDKLQLIFKFACAHCAKTFPSQYKLDNHIRTHTGERPHKCPFPSCARAFAQKASMQRHYKNHSESRPLYVCEHCCKQYKAQSNLYLHLQMNQIGQLLLPFKCHHDSCNMLTFVTNCSLQKHISSSHLAGMMSHVCEQCGKGFRSPSDLTLHKRTHTGEKPYKCPFDNCNAAFSQLGAMKLHHKSHTGQLPHVCAHCSTGFRTPGRLKVHIRTHTGERPFQCTWKDCGMHFISKYSMAKHCITHGSIGGNSIQSVQSENN